MSPAEERVARSKWRWLLIGAAVAYIGVLILVPLVSLAMNTLALGPRAIFDSLWQPDVIAALRLTLIASVWAVVVHSVFGTAVAWLLVRHDFPGRKILNGLIDLPLAVSPVVAGYMLLLLFGRNGWLTGLTKAMHFEIAFAPPGVVLATMFVSLPFMVREMMPLMRTLAHEQEEAAQTMGASARQTFWRIIFPALRPGFLYGISLTFARSLGEFGAVLVVGGGIRMRTETATGFIYRALEERQYGGAWSAALLLGACSLLLVFGTELLSRRGHASQELS